MQLLVGQLRRRSIHNGLKGTGSSTRRGIAFIFPEGRNSHSHQLLHLHLLNVLRETASVV
jgi:hypothetical protein